MVFKSKNGKRILQLTEPEFDMKMFCDRGIDFAYAITDLLTGDFRKVEPNETYFNGYIKVIDSKNIEIYIKEPINAKYNERGEIINKEDLEYKESEKIINISYFNL